MKNYIRNVELQIRDLERSLDFYGSLVGLKYEKNNGSAYVFSSVQENYLFKLVEIKNSMNVIRNETGLFHTAIKVPDRAGLAIAFYNLYNKKAKFGGFSDHLVSEAIYLEDPDGNGLEIYSDKSEDKWVWINDEVEMSTDPLDLNDLMKDINNRDSIETISDKTIIGHIHLKVSDLLKAASFYRGILGMDITNKSYNGAMFFSWDKYHHHIGTNIWNSRNGKNKSDKTSGLLSFEIELPEYLDKTEIISKLTDKKLIIENKPEFVLVNDFDYNKIKIIL